MNDHYKLVKPQTIERMQSLMTAAEFQGFCRGNILKYAERLYLKETAMSNALKIIDYANWLKESLKGEKIRFGLNEDEEDERAVKGKSDKEAENKRSEIGRIDGARIDRTVASAEHGEQSDNVRYGRASVCCDARIKRQQSASGVDLKNDAFRGFERVDKDLHTIMPRRATKYSAGYDICSMETKTIHAGATEVFTTNVKAYMNRDEVLMIYGRSSLAIKKGLVLATGVSIIDADYYGNEENDGEIMIALRNEGEEAVTIYRDQAIAQGIFQKYLTCGEKSAEKRRGGIGSTD